MDYQKAKFTFSDISLKNILILKAAYKHQRRVEHELKKLKKLKKLKELLI